MQPGRAELVAAGMSSLVAGVLRFDGMFVGIVCKAEGKTAQLEVVCKEVGGGAPWTRVLYIRSTDGDLYTAGNMMGLHSMPL